jgi:hypothetical protein
MNKYRGTYGGKDVVVSASNADSAMLEVCTLLNVPSYREHWVILVKIN